MTELSHQAQGALLSRQPQPKAGTTPPSKDHLGAIQGLNEQQGGSPPYKKARGRVHIGRPIQSMQGYSRLKYSQEKPLKTKVLSPRSSLQWDKDGWRFGVALCRQLSWKGTSSFQVTHGTQSTMAAKSTSTEHSLVW